MPRGSVYVPGDRYGHIPIYGSTVAPVTQRDDANKGKGEDMKGRLVAILATLAMVLGLISTGSASAAPPKAPTANTVTTPADVTPAGVGCPCRHPVTWWTGQGTGYSYGPNKYTHYQKGTIVGWKKVSGATYAKLKLTANPALAGGGPAGSKTVTVNTTTGQVYDSNGTIMQPNDWWNPFSWDWGKILGTMEHILELCAQGVEKGVIGSASTTIIWNMILRGVHFIELTPQGLAAAAVGGCVLNIYWSY